MSPTKPTPKNTRMAGTFVRPHFDLEKDGKRMIELEFSIPLTSAHIGSLPPQVEKAWSYLEAGDIKTITVVNIAPHTLDVGPTPLGDDRDLHLTAAAITKAALAVIEEPGTGDAVKVIRFTFRARTEMTRTVAHYANWNYGDMQHLQMVEAQPALDLKRSKP